MWGRDWLQVRGRVLAARPKANWQKWQRYEAAAPHEYVVEYRLEDSEPQRAEFQQSVPATDARWVFPSEGQTVPLLVHPGSGEVKLDTKTLRRDREAARKAEQEASDAEFEEKLHNG